MICILCPSSHTFYNGPCCDDMHIVHIITPRAVIKDMWLCAKMWLVKPNPISAEITIGWNAHCAYEHTESRYKRHVMVWTLFKASHLLLWWYEHCSYHHTSYCDGMNSVHIITLYCDGLTIVRIITQYCDGMNIVHIIVLLTVMVWTLYIPSYFLLCWYALCAHNYMSFITALGVSVRTLCIWAHWEPL